MHLDHGADDCYCVSTDSMRAIAMATPLSCRSAAPDERAPRTHSSARAGPDDPLRVNPSVATARATAAPDDLQQHDRHPAAGARRPSHSPDAGPALRPADPTNCICRAGRNAPGSRPRWPAAGPDTRRLERRHCDGAPRAAARGQCDRAGPASRNASRRFRSRRVSEPVRLFRAESGHAAAGRTRD
jgi:hypothetical protein